MAKDKSKIDIERILYETEGAYSRQRYGAVGWKKSIDNLAKLGYTEDDIILILNSKYMRWAADHYDEGKEYGELSGDEIVKYEEEIGIDLDEMAGGGKEGGGEIKNQYVGKTAEQVWDKLNKEQRIHFVRDHRLEIFPKGDYYGLDAEELANFKYNELKNHELGDIVRMRFDAHVGEGQYAGGGIPNNYEGETPSAVWDAWTEDQRRHFLRDHIDKLPGDWTWNHILTQSSKSFENIDPEIKQIVQDHVSEGQYAGGGSAHHGEAYAGSIGGRRYRLGDKWSKDFDYRGMLETGLNVNPGWKTEDLEKLFKSFESVNYHTEAAPLYIAILHRKGITKTPDYYPDEPEYRNAQVAINVFHDRVRGALAGYAGGGAHHGKEGGTKYENEVIDGYYVKNNLTPKQLNKYAAYRKAGAFKKQALEMALTTQKERENFAGGSAHHGGAYAGGRGIPDNYKGKTAEQVWDAWTEDQRWHFAEDHELTDNVSTKTLKMNSSELKKDDWGKAFRHQTSWDWISGVLEEHIEQGSYAGGGSAKGSSVIEKLKRAIASSKTSPADRDKMREALHKLQLPTPPPKPKPVKVEKKVKPIELPHLQFLTENKIDVKSLPLKTRQKINGIKMLAGKKSDKARDKAKTLSEALIKSIKAGMKPSNKLNDRKKEEIRENYEKRREAKKALVD